MIGFVYFENLVFMVKNNNAVGYADKKLSAEANELKLRFESSDLFSLLSDDDRNALLEAMQENDELIMGKLRKLLNEEDERNKEILALLETIKEDTINPILQAFERRRALGAIREAEKESEASENDGLNKLLN